MVKAVKLPSCLSIILIATVGMKGQAPGLLYPYGEDAGDMVMAPGDDTFVAMPTSPFKFHGETFSGDVFISSNGVITFDAPDVQFQAQSFPSGDGKMIALFWDDHFPDQEPPGNKVFFRASTDSALMDQLTQDIMQHFGCEGEFTATWACVVTFENVRPSTNNDFHNTYQAVLVTDGVKSFVFLQYETIEWTGAGGAPTQVGFNIGDESLTLPGSGTESVTDLVNNSNVGVPGRWLYRVDEVSISEGSCPQSECVCEYGEDIDGDKFDELVRFDGSVKHFRWRGDQLSQKVLAKIKDPDDPCRFKLEVNTWKASNGGVILTKMYFYYGIDGKQQTSTYQRNIVIGGPDITLREGGEVTPLDLTVPFEVPGDPQVTLSLDGDVVLLQSDDCPWDVEYRLGGDEKVTFRGPSAPYEGKCGSCT